MGWHGRAWKKACLLGDNGNKLSEYARYDGSSHAPQYLQPLSVCSDNGRLVVEVFGDKSRSPRLGGKHWQRPLVTVEKSKR